MNLYTVPEDFMQQIFFLLSNFEEACKLLDGFNQHSSDPDEELSRDITNKRFAIISFAEQLKEVSEFEANA